LKRRRRAIATPGMTDGTRTDLALGGALLAELALMQRVDMAGPTNGCATAG
jgi:hypothetical protein